MAEAETSEVEVISPGGASPVGSDYYPTKGGDEERDNEALEKARERGEGEDSLWADGSKLGTGEVGEPSSSTRKEPYVLRGRDETGVQGVNTAGQGNGNKCNGRQDVWGKDEVTPPGRRWTGIGFTWGASKKLMTRNPSPS